MLWWVWISQLRRFWRQELSFSFCSYTWRLLALCLLTFIDVIHFYVNGAALSIVRTSSSAHQTSIQANSWHFLRIVKMLLLLFHVNLLFMCLYGKKEIFLSVSKLAELRTCLVEGFILNFISVGVSIGNFNFAEAHPSFYSEVVEEHLCFCGVSFHHWIMSILAVPCAFAKSHTQRV